MTEQRQQQPIQADPMIMTQVIWDHIHQLTESNLVLMAKIIELEEKCATLQTIRNEDTSE